MTNLKHCIKCGRSEGEVTFAIGRNACKECRKAYNRKYYKDNPGYFEAYREGNQDRLNKLAQEANRQSKKKRYALIKVLKESSPCMDCGYHYPYFVMDFDHRDPSLKRAGVNTLVKTLVPWGEVLEEISKCDLVCTRCHRLRTYKGQNCYRTRRFEQHRSVLDELKSTIPCLDCGGQFKPCQMDFDHIHSKLVNVARLVAEPPDKLSIELGKCHLVCANCHRVRTNTGVRPDAPEHSEMLVRVFESILSRTSMPEDKRVVPFPFPHLLGVVPDKELSAQTGISRDMVSWYRRKDGIRLTHNGEVDPNPHPDPKAPAPKPWHELAGKLTDQEVADRFGITSVSVTAYRKKVGTPSFKPSWKTRLKSERS